MPGFNPSYEEKKTGKRSREDDEDNLGSLTTEISSSSLEEEEHNIEVTQPLATEISPEEEKAVEDSFFLSKRLLKHVSCIMSYPDRLKQDTKWNQYIQGTQFYLKTIQLFDDWNCKTLEGYESLEEDTESTHSLSSGKEDNLECAQPLAEEEDKTEGMEEEASAEVEDKMEGMEEEVSAEEEDYLESSEEVASSEEEDYSESSEEVASSEEEDYSESSEEVASSEKEDNSEIPEEVVSSEEHLFSTHWSRHEVELPVVFGRYSATTPDRIPYHLYLLVKEADDIMMSPGWPNTNLLTKLTSVESKIWFFCTYLHCHLPHGWKYKREAVREVVSRYDPARKPIYNMDGYTPITQFHDFQSCEYDEISGLSRQTMLLVMKIIHSRKTPKYWTMHVDKLAFYCRLCSCFGIDYARLEDASEDDVCLMDVGSFSELDDCYL